MIFYIGKRINKELKKLVSNNQISKTKNFYAYNAASMYLVYTMCVYLCLFHCSNKE